MRTVLPGFHSREGVALDPDDAVNDPDSAREEYGRLIATGDEDEVAEAIFLLAALERNLGRTVEARTALERAIATGHVEVTPKAWGNLAVLEAVEGRVEAARAAFRKAVLSAHPEHAPQAMFNFGLFERRQGNVGAARKLYRQAIATGHHEHARKALLNLGNLEAEQGRTAEARDLYQRAMATGHSDTQTRARQGLQQLEQAAQRCVRAVPPCASPDQELIRRKLCIDLDEVQDANWVTGHRPAYGNGEIEIWTRDDETRIIFLDQREPDDFLTYMYLKNRFGLE
ncbi:tetratricopeptide repeat protein [Spirillospora sp. CA-108201]